MHSRYQYLGASVSFTGLLYLKLRATFIDLTFTSRVETTPSLHLFFFNRIYFDLILGHPQLRFVVFEIVFVSNTANTVSNTANLS